MDSSASIAHSHRLAGPTMARRSTVNEQAVFGPAKRRCGASVVVRWLPLLLLPLTGCPSNSPPLDVGAPSPKPTMVQMTVVESAPPATSESGPRDPVPIVPVVFNINVYILHAPFGTFTNNSDFWKNIDEQCVDVGTSHLLYINGIRLGQAHLKDFEIFTKILGKDPPVQRVNVAGREGKRVEIEMVKDLPQQLLFHFDRTNGLVGRNYDRCTNIMTMSFEPTPRRPGELRLALTPMVRAMRKRIEFTAMNNAQEIQFVSPELFYDLNLRVDIAPQHFFVVAPSPDAAHLTSIGAAFLTRTMPPNLEETVLLIVPQAIRIEERTSIPVPGNPNSVSGPVPAVTKP